MDVAQFCRIGNFVSYTTKSLRRNAQSAFFYCRLEFFCEFLYFIYVQHSADGMEWNCVAGFESFTS